MKIKISSKIAIGSFLIASLGIFIITYLSYVQVSGYFKENLLEHLSVEFQHDSNHIKRELNSIKNDVLIISKSKSINKLTSLNSEDINYNKWKVRCQDEFKTYLKQQDSYLQVRFIGIKNNGKEIVRVDRINDKIVTIKSHMLQNKASRYYLKNTIKLKQGELFISKIDLNRERGKIVLPMEPTIRISTPIYKDDKVVGIVIINTNINILFNLDRYKEDNEYKKTFLSNSDGYYIFHNDINKIFGFEFDKDIKIQNNLNLKKLFNSDIQSLNFYDENNTAIFAKKIMMDDNFIVIARSATNIFLKEQSNEYIKIISLYIVLIAILIAIFVLIFTKLAISPIELLTKKAKLVSNIDCNNTIKFNDFKTNDEIEELAQSLELMVENLKCSQNNIRTKDQLLEQQSKLAAMGEMVGAIAHQWRQPLNALAVQVQFIEDDFEDGIVNKKYLDDYKKENMKLINFMSNTIDDFRNFFRIDKVKTKFSIYKKTNETVNILKGQLNSHDIEIFINEDSFDVLGYSSEFQQVILNIINNAKDELIEKKIANPKITIHINSSNEKGTITISDNAGGIKEDILDRVFEPYFTTKEQGKGTGIGLYMSKMIIDEHMDGKLSVANINDGAQFKIILNTKTTNKDLINE